MKIDLFTKMIREKALTEPKAVLDALNKKHAQILDDMERACELDRHKYLEDIYNRHHDKKVKAIAKAHSEAQTRILKKRSELFESLKEGLSDKVKLYAKSEQYQGQLTEKVKAALNELGNVSPLVVVTRSEDAAYMPEGLNIVFDDRLLGGFYVLRNDTEKFDFTLDSALDHLDAFLGCMMNTLYEITGEDCDEHYEYHIQS